MKNLLHHLKPDLKDIVHLIGEIAQQKGMKAYLVGGPVRDLFLGMDTIDLDIAIEGNAIELADAFAAKFLGKVTRYPAFKTATVYNPGAIVDFATARKETYSKGGAYPAVSPSNIQDDLLRRDFTINAMAIGLNPKFFGKLVDPFKGQADLKAKKIRILHDQSFVDDPTRILRAARFMARLNFKMEAKTLKTLKSALKIKVLDTIKPQRYLKDFNKILKEPNSLMAIKILRNWKAEKQEYLHENRKS